jgi:tetratricopeptide (TPR) repeat protein
MTVSEGKTYTEAEAHRYFAIQFNGKTWELLDKPQRTKWEDELMIHSAHASSCHWLEAGTGVHHQRGEWLVSRVYAVLGQGEAALRHARRCLELTEEYADLLEDFDQAYALECVARAHAIAGNREEALRYIELAEEAGRVIADEENREIFFRDLNSGYWSGLR